MKYEVIRSCMIKGLNCPVGFVIDVDDSTAKDLMAIGRLAPHHEEPAKNEDRSVGLSGSKPKTRSKSKKARISGSVADAG